MTSCADMHDPELHASYILGVTIEVNQSVTPDDLWQPNWRDLWRMTWLKEEDMLVKSEPKSFHIDVADQSYDFMGRRRRLYLSPGIFDLLCYNNDQQYVDPTPARRSLDVWADTPPFPYATVVDSVMGKIDVRYQPDATYRARKPIEIYDDLSRYVYLPDEGIYLLEDNVLLQPCVFTYLVQATLLHNRGRVRSCGAFTLGGMAQAVNLADGALSPEPVALQSPGHFEQQTAGTDTLTLCGARIATFGPCSQQPSLLYIALNYSNGGRRIVVRDITAQTQRLPTGGVITLTLDMDDDDLQPPDPPANQGGQGGFGFQIDGYDKENHVIRI